MSGALTGGFRGDYLKLQPGFPVVKGLILVLRRLDSVLQSSERNYCPVSAEELKNQTCTKKK